MKQLKTDLKNKLEKNIQIVQGFKSNNTKLLVVASIFILGFLLYGIFNNNYHKKEIKALEKEIGAIQKRFDVAVKDKERFKDSSEVYEDLAEQEALKAEHFRTRAESEKRSKQAALAALQNLSKDVIDTFFVERYAAISKSDIGLELDKNVGNAIVIELVEKDHLEDQLTTYENLSTTLTSQVNNLQTALSFSKSALVSADSAIEAKSKQFELQQEVSNLLKDDLKKAKKKAFWDKIKGTAIGVAVGLAVGLIAVN